MQPAGEWNWPLALPTPERAVLELLDELPKRESFHQADMLVNGGKLNKAYQIAVPENVGAVPRHLWLARLACGAPVRTVQVAN